MRTLKTLIIGFCIVALLAIIAPVQAVTPAETNIITKYFNITFDNVQGGVVTSLKYKGVDFLTGSDNGAWGAIGIRKSTWNGSGYVCTRWAQDMIYQYDEYNNVDVEEKSNRYVVTITPIMPMAISVKPMIIGREIKWTIWKRLKMITVTYKPVYNNEYLYFPFIRDYNSKKGMLTFFTVGNGLVQAQDLPYCESRGYKAPLVSYKIKDYDTGKISKMFIFGNRLPQRVKYYGNDTSTWQLHYPMKQKNLRIFRMIFHDGGWITPV